ncbi:hypothetical protein MASR1M32_35710 [Rhodobacter sp.]
MGGQAGISYSAGTAQEPPMPQPAANPLYAIPLIGRMAREISEDTDNVLYAIVIAFTLLVLAALKWGAVVFTLAAIAAVPLVFLFFIVISWPFGPKGKS